MKRFTLSLTLALLPFALAQNASAPTTTLSAATQAALNNGADVRTAQANLDKAQASLKATEADPSALVADTLQAQQAAALAAVQLQNAKIGTLQSALSAYAALYTAQENVDLQTLQVQSDSKNLQVVQVKLNVKNATALDLKNAQSSLDASTQNLADAKAQVNIAAQKLAAITGLSSSVRASGLGTIPTLKVSQASLTAGLNARLPSVVQAQQAVDLAQLNVKLYDNDFTPAQTLSNAKVTLANAQRSLESATKNAATTLSSAYQSAANAQQLLSVALQKETNAQTSYHQDQTRLKTGVISAVDLLKSQLALAQAQQNRVSAQASALNTLASLSVASGTNLTGVGGL
ncbi:TolC family protein [Deinococcus irradiatisoli]|uniref:TolC family protein n=1 Tax=Deinococcus irradiatisoli TaxID=2202254 RepID=A0A2Z3JSB3_9DEIO|nr:TolC family protein [Deinococcus irradiatisoli]AWN24168.1 TolC family protein [Deinococcus irradiatisoli]